MARSFLKTLHKYTQKRQLKRIKNQRDEEKAAVFYYNSLMRFHFEQIRKDAEENKLDKERKSKILVLLSWRDFMYGMKRQRKMQEDA